MWRLAGNLRTRYLSRVNVSLLLTVPRNCSMLHSLQRA